MSKYNDYLGHVRVQTLEDSLFNLIDGQQKSRNAPEAFSALALLFVLESYTLDINISETLHSVNRMLKHLEATDTQKLRAIREYIAKEMPL